MFNLAVEKPLYHFDPQHQLKLLTPNIQHEGSLARITSNSMGLRSPEIARNKTPGEYRVAIVGASSVMGAYSKTNDHTMAAFLQARLRQAMPTRTVHVINAGIAGADLDDQQDMLRYIAPLAPDLVVLYPGFNDLAGYCRKAGKTGVAAPWRPPILKMPSFLLSTDLLLKNTVFLRTQPPAGPQDLDPKTLDTSEFVQDLDELLDASQALGLNTVVSTISRAYRPTQPLEEQEGLAATALYYHPCFTLQDLHEVHDMHNDILRKVARDKQVPIVELSLAIPGGKRYFADASHFTEAGERMAAELLHDTIWAAPARTGMAVPR